MESHQNISLLAVLPFVLMLASIAVFPLFAAHFWEHNRNKLLVALVLGVPAAGYLLVTGLAEHLLHTMIFDYVPFVILLGSLFVITGGIAVTGDIEATPAVNTMFLALGAVLASIMGTTGASMLLIRPILQTNCERTYRVHTVLFFIGIVANCGGVLTPLGDPPLFVLYLHGVPFAWFFRLWPLWVFVNAVLLAVYFATETYFHGREPAAALRRDVQRIEPIRINGQLNIVLVIGVVLAVAVLNQQYIEFLRTHASAGFIREIAIAALAAASLALTPSGVRAHNNFTWGPIEEVAYLFFGIFITMVPCMLYLQWNANALGITTPVHFYYAAGSLSSVLDNTPTALTFYSLALGLAQSAPEMVAGVPSAVVAAIAAGAVFFGSLTYIGNGPNFMVKAIAEENGVAMPDFFRYVLLFSLPVLLPVFVLAQLLLL
jgi:Na+/H+ antiporter NhaD/arsenite permease-like protein